MISDRTRSHNPDPIRPRWATPTARWHRFPATPPWEFAVARVDRRPSIAASSRAVAAQTALMRDVERTGAIPDPDISVSPETRGEATGRTTPPFAYLTMSSLVGHVTRSTGSTVAREVPELTTRRLLPERGATSSKPSPENAPGKKARRCREQVPSPSCHGVAWLMASNALKRPIRSSL